MKLEDQVVSLELAKRMEELGFKQDSLFWWHLPNEQEAFIVKSKIDEYAISAFTVAELGEMLPWMIRELPPFLYLQIEKDHHGWIVRYQFMEEDQIEEAGDTLVEAMAKMLIYLAENGLINPKPQSNE